MCIQQGRFFVFLLLVIGNVWSNKILSFEEFYQKALIRHGMDQSFNFNKEALQKEKIQSQRYTNPSFSIGLENFGVGEIEVTSSQTIELPKKRHARLGVFTAEQELLDAEKKSLHREIKVNLYEKVLPIYIGYSRMAIFDSILHLIDKEISVLEERVSFGGAMQLDLMRTRVVKSSYLIEKEKVHRHLKNVEKAFSLYATGDETFRVSPAYLSPSPLLELSKLSEMVSKNSDLILLEKERVLLQNEKEEILGDALPDLEFTAGYARNNELKENSILLEFSTEIPLFNRNVNAGKSKDLQVKALTHKSAVLQWQKESELHSVYTEYKNSETHINAIINELLPKQQAIHDTISSYYKQGRVPIFDVLESRKELIETRLTLVDEYATLGESLIRIFALTGHIQPFTKEIEHK